ncbi:ABC transporter ATP-binding protein [Blochmannia endosymbiont of Camponotus sp. C-003]|uniref:metal ABC transporter ATP-binding protein n=1 Tax=unclassified Candidatus Blochmanniella TaxID=711328 RepID=UPI002024BAE3|nr:MULTISPECIES: ABC transporter ATP-binding protein [unclassified Candidatus Blochmannia]URJ23187.1 ABC transporter ATP-binding protein [Blochmannia endosymbiont of Camponotus sp. C-003]URJ28656.1 ABC transporter ATP-binding protein [Blochmannia endosymbiont of Camponotus sp. C-046]
MITLHNLIAGYYGRNVSPSVSGQIKYGSMIAIVGPNGIGKSTLLKTLAGLLPPVSGRLEFGKKGKPRMGYLPQNRTIDHHFPLTVFDVVSMGCWPRVNLLKRLNRYQIAVIWRSLDQVKLLDVLNQYIETLSGGQVQRMLFARILAQKASLILLDEPFQGIDMNTCKIMIRAVNLLCRRGCTVIAALHNNEFVTEYFPNILSLTRFRSVWNPSI